MLPYRVDLNGMDDVLKIFRLFKSQRGELSENKEGKLTISVADDKVPEYMRKCVEYIFHGTQRENAILDPNDDGTTGKGGQKKSGSKTNRNQNRSSIIVKVGGKSYTELLKTVKDKVDIAEMGVKVGNPRTTARGNLFIQVSGGNKDAEKLTKALKDKVSEMEIAVKKDQTVMHINGIDADFTPQMIKEGLMKLTKGLGEEEVAVTSLGPNRDGSQTATVTMPKRTSRKLRNIDRVRLGWSSCRIRTRIEVPRCYNCVSFEHKD